MSIEQMIPVSGKNRSKERAATAAALAMFEEARRQELDVIAKAKANYYQIATLYRLIAAPFSGVGSGFESQSTLFYIVLMAWSTFFTVDAAVYYIGFCSILFPIEPRNTNRNASSDLAHNLRCSVVTFCFKTNSRIREPFAFCQLQLRPCHAFLCFGLPDLGSICKHELTQPVDRRRCGALIRIHRPA